MARCWPMKSEPDVYSIEDLEQAGVTCWEGVCNYHARNLMREMELGDPVLFYHCNAKPRGVAGLARVSREAYPDHFSWQPGHKYFDPKSSEEDTLPRFVPLDELKQAGILEEMVVTKRSRLSVQPVRLEEHDVVLKLAELG